MPPRCRCRAAWRRREATRNRSGWSGRAGTVCRPGDGNRQPAKSGEGQQSPQTPDQHRRPGEIRRRRVDRRNWSYWRGHLDEVFVRINGEPHYPWRAVDHEGEVLEVFATKRRDRGVALKFLKRAMKRYGRPVSIVTDRLRSYRAALKAIGNEVRQETKRWLNNRAENSHQPFRRRERAVFLARVLCRSRDRRRARYGQTRGLMIPT